LWTKLNAERAAGGLAALALQPWASSVARAHSQEMAAARDIWHNHTGYLDIARQAIGAMLTGENVAEAGTLDETDSLFMHSPPHRANILYPAFTQVGIGVALDDVGYVYVTQDFLTLRPAPAARAAAAPPPAQAQQPARPPAPPPGRAVTARPAAPATTASPATEPAPPPATAPPTPAPEAPSPAPPQLGPLAASPVSVTGHPAHDSAIAWPIALAALAGACSAWITRPSLWRRHRLPHRRPGGPSTGNRSERTPPPPHGGWPSAGSRHATWCPRAMHRSPAAGGPAPTQDQVETIPSTHMPNGTGDR
jgi:hypothetical protein